MCADAGEGGGFAPSRGDTSKVLADVRNERQRSNSFELFSDLLDRLAWHIDKHGLSGALIQRINGWFGEPRLKMPSESLLVAAHTPEPMGQWSSDVEASFPGVVQAMQGYCDGDDIPLVLKPNLEPSFRRQLCSALGHLLDIRAGGYRTSEELSSAAEELHFYARKIMEELADLRCPELPPGWRDDVPTNPLAKIGDLREYAQTAYQRALEFADAIHPGQSKINEHRAAVSRDANIIVNNICAWLSWKNGLPRESMLDSTKDSTRQLIDWLAWLEAKVHNQSDATSLTQKDRPTTETNTPFKGGEIVFYLDRVEVCGVDICSGPRCGSKRVVLELLSRRREDGLFTSYSGEDLEAEAKRKGAKGRAAGWIRDLRRDITESLRNKASIISLHKDVILSGDGGYRLAECLTVRFIDPAAITDIAVMGDADNVRNDNVRNVHDDEAGGRRAWILQQLQQGHQLRAPAAAKQFKCHVKTAQRDLTALKNEKRIEFVGSPRTGYYRIRSKLKPGP